MSTWTSNFLLDWNEPPTDIDLSRDLRYYENSEEGKHIATILVSDPDRNDTFQCYAVRSSYFKVTGITLLSGIVSVDYESLPKAKNGTPTVKVNIKCNDKLGLSIEKSFDIAVTGELSFSLILAVFCKKPTSTRSHTECQDYIRSRPLIERSLQ